MDIDLALKYCVEVGTFGHVAESGKARFKCFRAEQSPSMIGYKSKVQFGRIVYSVKDNDLISEPLTVKTMLESNKYDAAFMNEVSVYSKVLPFLAEFDSDRSSMSELVAEFYYGNVTVSSRGTDHAILVMENLTAASFEPCRIGFFLDFEHLSLAMIALGRLHVRSYLAKQVDAERFEEQMNRLHQALENPLTSFPGYKEACVELCMDVLRDSDSSYQTKLSELRPIIDNIDRHIGSIYSKSNQSSVSVLCHGDTVRNNLLFKYSDDGKPVEVKLCDFGSALYCSPAFDLFNLLYLSTDQRIRDKHWDELLDLYHRSMLDFSPKAAAAVPSLESIVSEFGPYAPHIYAISTSYVLPIVSGGMEMKDSTELPKGLNTKQYFLELVKSSCSESAIRVVNEVLVDMIDRSII